MYICSKAYSCLVLIQHMCVNVLWKQLTTPVDVVFLYW